MVKNPNLRWVLISLAPLASVAALDVALGSDVALIGLLIAAPLIASLRLGATLTAAIAACAVVTGLLLGLANQDFGEIRHLTRMLTVVVGGGIAIWAARLREQHASGEDVRAGALDAEREARRVAQEAEAGRAESHALLDTLLSNAPVGLAFVDRDLRYVRVNPSLAAINGLTPDEHVGRTVAEVVPDMPELESLHRQVLDSGQAIVDLDLSGETVAAPGVKRHWLAGYYPVSRAGATIGVGVVIVDITDRKRAERQARLLADASALLETSLDYEPTLANAARIGVPELADWCVVDVIDQDGELRRHAVAHVDPGGEALAWELDRLHPADLRASSGRAAVIRARRPQLLREVSDAMLGSLADDDEHIRMLRGIGSASVILLPLMSRGESFGVMTLGVADAERAFDEHDLAIASEVAERAATAIDNARLHRDRSYIARRLQESLLPPALPEIPGLELAARYVAAGEENQVGGDFYDVFQTATARWSLVIGDVRGKGADAAALIGLARHTLRAAAMRESSTDRILATLNEVLYREGSDDSVCTALHAGLELRPTEVRVEVTCAGHPLALIRRADGRVETAGQPGTLLGAVPELELHCEAAVLGPGDALVLYTDGVSEARSESEGFFGQDRLLSLLDASSDADAPALAERIERRVLDFQDGDPRDDVAIVVARVTLEGAGTGAHPAVESAQRIG